jgi:hypothetical protein
LIIACTLAVILSSVILSLLDSVAHPDRAPARARKQASEQSGLRIFTVYLLIKNFLGKWIKLDVVAPMALRARSDPGSDRLQTSLLFVALAVQERDDLGTC